MTAPRRGELAGLAAIAATLAGFLVWWWTRYRAGMPWYIDEAGYLDFAVDHAQAISDGSLTALRESIERQAPAAPLVPLVTALAVVVTDRPVGSAVATMAAAAVALVVATWFLARWFVPPAWALLAAGTVGALPSVLSLSGAYYFATPAAAAFTAGVACLLRSRWGARPGWVLAAGAAFGAAALARTMVIGLLLPVLVVAAIGAVATGGRQHAGKHLVTLLAGAVVAAAVAAPWYLADLDGIVDYLTSGSQRRGVAVGTMGSGGTAGPGGRALPVPGMRDLRLLIGDLLVPMAVVLVTMLAAAGWGWMRARRTGEEPGAAAAGVAGLAAVVGGGAAVFVVADHAIGQWMPLLPAMVVLVLVAVRRWGSAGIRRTAVVALTALSVVHLVEASRLVGPLDGVRVVAAGPLGRLPTLDNRTLLEQRLARRLDGTHLDRSYQAVASTLADVAGEVVERATASGEPGVVLVTGDQDAVVNLNSLQLADDLAHGSSELVVGALPVVAERTPEEWATVLADPAIGQPNAVLTIASSRQAGPRGGADRTLVAALPVIGFEAVFLAALPDGDGLVLWWRPRAELVAGSP